MTLYLYVTRRFLKAVLQVLAVVAILAGLLTMVENSRIAAESGAAMAQAAALTALQIPSVLSESFPLVLLLAALAAFLGLSRSSEMVVVRASGVSAIRVLVAPVAAAALLGILAMVAVNPVISAVSQKAVEYRSQLTGQRSSILSFDEQSLWLRQGLADGQTVIQASHASEQGMTLFGVRLHQFDTNNRLTDRVEADSATLAAGDWLLRGVRRWDLDLEPGQPLKAPEELSQLRVPTNLTREQIMDSFAQPDQLALWSLPGFIRQLERAGFSATRHRVFLQSELALPALFAAMVLIGAGFSLRHVRFGQTGVRILFAVMAGFSLYFFKDVTETLGANGDIPVALAAWSPPAAAILLALGLLLHLEDG